jgi:iron(III) transport system ATP-binding protein
MANSKTSYLSIKGLTKKYNDHLILDQLDLHVNQFEKLSIIGQSGTGKSTLLKLIYGLLDKDAGVIRLEEVRVKDRSEVLVPGDDRVKYVRQNYELFPDHTVYENIEHQIRYHKKEYIDKRIKKLLKAFDIEDIAKIKTKLTSGGEQQRVAICCALAESPKLLLLDEPLAHLDPINAQLIKEYLWRFIAKEKITTIAVTHSSQDALAYSTKIAVLDKGKILEQGTPQELYYNPKKKTTAELLGLMTKIPKGVTSTTSKKSIYLRPEHIHLTTNGVKTVCTSSIFLGQHYLIGFVLEKSRGFLCHNQAIEEGQEIELSFDLDKAMHL